MIFNLRVTHSPAGLAQARQAFRRLNDRALERGGSFYLTYHRWATRAQLLAAYPQLPAVLAQARAWDPAGTFNSDWRRHVEATLGSGPALGTAMPGGEMDRRSALPPPHAVR